MSLIQYVFGFHVYGCVSRFTRFLFFIFIYVFFFQPAMVDKSTVNNTRVFSFLFLFMYFFFQSAIVDKSTVNSASVHCSRVPQITLFSNFFIKNGSHSTIYTFKNYFATVFSVSVFSFSKNKLYPNGPIVTCGRKKGNPMGESLHNNFRVTLKDGIMKSQFDHKQSSSQQPRFQVIPPRLGGQVFLISLAASGIFCACRADSLVLSLFLLVHTIQPIVAKSFRFF